MNDDDLRKVTAAAFSFEAEAGGFLRRFTFILLRTLHVIQS